MNTLENILIIAGISLDVFASMEIQGAMLQKVNKKTLLVVSTIVSLLQLMFFIGGYAAGYYSYLWTEVLAVNVADYFAKHGALNPAVGQAFRDKILSRGNTKDQMLMFTDFTGMRQPDASGLLKARGL